MSRLFLMPFFLLIAFGCSSQNTIEKTLERFNSGNVPYITTDEVLEIPGAVLLDTRKEEEYKVSHLENARWVGYRNVNLSAIQQQIADKNTPIIVYCSVGVRSENVGETLQKAGYTNVKNLYGGIFQWVNEGKPIVNSNAQKTDSVHAYSKHWGNLLTKGTKVYSLKK